MTAAANLFSRHGFDGTTTRQISTSARVNEAIIFRHFTSKEELYWAVVSEQIQRRSYPQPMHRRLRSPQATTEALSKVAQVLLDRSKEDAALTRLLLFSLLRNSELSEKLLRNYMRGPLDLLSDYIRQGVERGWLRNVDPVVGARAFLGMLAAQNLVQELLGSAGHQKYDFRQLGQQISDIWLNGVSARPFRFVAGIGKNGHRPAKKVANSPASTRKHAVTA